MINKKSFLYIRSDTENNACIRLHYYPLKKGMMELGIETAEIIITDEIKLDRDINFQYIIALYLDINAIRLGLQLKNKYKAKIILLCADIYDLETYRQLEIHADYFITPTKIHKKILNSVVSIPVVFVPESIDSIAYPLNTTGKRNTNGNNICWFGYPESFIKSFKYIRKNVSDIYTYTNKKIGIISSSNPINSEEYEFIEFSTNTFYENTSNYKVALLSHFPHDMHLNTYIKSPNKLITSIARGLIPICSETPSYEELMLEYDADYLIFKRGDDILKIYQSIVCNIEIHEKKINLMKECIENKLSHKNIARIFLENII